MACYDPVSVPNPRIDFRYGLDNCFIKAPCGKCAACQKQKRDDWFVRLYYEWQNTRKDGICVFPTFTYNPSHVPHVDTSSDEFSCLKDLTTVDLPVDFYDSFDKIGFQNFIKKLRKRLFRDGYTDTETGLKYFVVTEYGSDLEKLHLPHYHVLFFLDHHVEPIILKRYFELAWSHRVLQSEVKSIIPQYIIDGAERYFARGYDANSKYKNIYVPIGKGNVCLYSATINKYGKIHYFLKNGNVSYSDISPIPENPEALSYLTKYMFKDSSFMATDKVKRLVKYLDSLPSVDDMTKEQKIAYKKLSGILPFNLVSNHLGISLFDELDIKTQLVTQYQQVIRDNLVPNRIVIPGYEDYYKIPTYVLNKLFYRDVDVIRQESVTLPDGSDIYFHKTCKKRLITALGKECLQMRMRLKVDEMVQHYRSVMNPSFFCMVSDHVSRLLSPGTHTYGEKECNFLHKYNSIVSVLSQCYSSIDPELLALYTLKFENLSLYGYDQRIKSYTSDDFKKLFFELQDGCIMTYDDISEFVESPMKEPKQLEFFINAYGTFRDLPIFENYSEVSTAFNELNTIISIIHSESRKKKDKLSDNIRQYFNSIKYVS